jgi:hypothetical protein
VVDQIIGDLSGDDLARQPMRGDVSAQPLLKLCREIGPQGGSEDRVIGHLAGQQFVAHHIFRVRQQHRDLRAGQPPPVAGSRHQLASGAGLGGVRLDGQQLLEHRHR